MNDPAYSRKTFWQEAEYLFKKIPKFGMDSSDIQPDRIIIFITIGVHNGSISTVCRP
mgnify:CR=1 FL=1